MNYFWHFFSFSCFFILFYRSLSWSKRKMQIKIVLEPSNILLEQKNYLLQHISVVFTFFRGFSQCFFLFYLIINIILISIRLECFSLGLKILFFFSLCVVAFQKLNSNFVLLIVNMNIWCSVRFGVSLIYLINRFQRE